MDIYKFNSRFAFGAGKVANWNQNVLVDATYNDLDYTSVLRCDISAEAEYRDVGFSTVTWAGCTNIAKYRLR
jgi:hypothetical protein